MTADYGTIVARGHGWVALRGPELVGVLVLEPEADHLLLENIAVSPAAQGQGVGTLLLGFADDEARRRQPAGGAPLHERGDDREPRLLPQARLPRDPPGERRWLRPGLLRQAGHRGRIAPHVAPDTRKPRTWTSGAPRADPPGLPLGTDSLKATKVGTGGHGSSRRTSLDVLPMNVAHERNIPSAICTMARCANGPLDGS